MSNLVVEMLLRLVKPAAATALGLIVFAVAIAVGEPASVTLALLSWVAGAAFILLVQESPI
jgi:hypothetical protein